MFQLPLQELSLYRMGVLSEHSQELARIAKSEKPVGLDYFRHEFLTLTSSAD